MIQSHVCATVGFQRVNGKVCKATKRSCESIRQISLSEHVEVQPCLGVMLAGCGSLRRPRLTEEGGATECQCMLSSTLGCCQSVVRSMCAAVWFVGTNDEQVMRTYGGSIPICSPLELVHMILHASGVCAAVAACDDSTLISSANLPELTELTVLTAALLTQRVCACLRQEAAVMSSSVVCCSLTI
jgi:hypothetical protein